jgi:hypothetical protein
VVRHAENKLENKVRKAFIIFRPVDEQSRVIKAVTVRLFAEPTQGIACRQLHLG